MGVWNYEDYEKAYQEAIEYVETHYPDNWRSGDYHYFIVYKDKHIELPYDEKLAKEFEERFKDIIEFTTVEIGYNYYESFFVKFK